MLFFGPPGVGKSISQSPCARRSIVRVTYNATIPLFLPHQFTVNTHVDDNGASLWATHEGGLAMDAKVDWGSPFD